MTGNHSIVGFDLGHGETALAFTRAGTKGGEPQPIEIDAQKSIVTAVGIDAGGAIAIGREVVLAAASPTESYTRFKHPQLDRHPTAGRAIRTFVRGVIDKLHHQHLLDRPDEAHFIVGCPSGWAPIVQAEYQRLLEQSGLRQVRVVPESRAAFLQAREMHEISAADLAGRVLLIDIGSSTTDFTYSENLNSRPVDFGHTAIGDIGAGLLDQLIFEYVIASHGAPSSIRAFIERYPGKASELDLKCRDIKHEYFNSAAGKGREVGHPVRLDKGMSVDVVLDDAIVTTLLAKPIVSLGNLSWPTAFERRLRSARDDQHVRPDLVIMTGGAARMAIVLDLVGAVFPEARIVRGREPELSIAKGLALFGRAEIAAHGFLADVDALVRGPAVEQVVERAVPDLISRLAKVLAQSVLADVMRPELIAWRNGEHRTLRAMEDRIKQRVGELSASSSVRDRIAEVTRAWFDDIRPTIHRLSDPICDKFGKPTAALAIEAGTHYSTLAGLGDGAYDMLIGGVETIGTVISAIVSTVVGMIVGGAGISLLSLPLIGQIIVGLGAFVGLLLGKQAAIEASKDLEIPNIGRVLVTNGRIDSNLARHEPKITDEIKRQLAAQDAGAVEGQRLRDKVGSQIDRALRQRADDAILTFE